MPKLSGCGKLLRIASLFALLGLCMLAGGCAQMSVQDASLLESARKASGGSLPLWEDGVHMVKAVIKPYGGVYGANNLILNAVYRADGQSTRFAIFLPQGSKLGQCERVRGAVKCSSSSLPGSRALVQASFAALDEVFELRPLEADRFELRQGEGPAADSGAILLKRQRNKADYRYSVFYDTSGKVLAAFKRRREPNGGRTGINGQMAAWKAEFAQGMSEYSFIPQGRPYTLKVSIISVR